MSVLEQSMQSVLVRYANQEFIDACTEGLQALAEHHYTEHELGLVNLLEVEDTDTLLMYVNDLIHTHLTAVCTMHRLSVNSEVSVSDLSKVVRALLHMQFWEDKNSIVTLCEADAPDEDKLAALIALVGELTEGQACDIIEEIDPNFIRGLMRLYMEDAFTTEDPDVMEIPPEQITKLRLYRNAMGAERSLAYRMVKAGYSPGASTEQYLVRVASSLVEKDNKAIAFEVVPFLLLARDGWANPLKAWREFNSVLNLEPQDVTGVDVEINKLLSDFDRLSTQGPNK